MDRRLISVLIGLGIVATALSPAGAQPGTSSERASVSSDGDQANADSHNPALSATGRFVAYQSVASNLVPDDTNDHSDVFLYDRDEDLTFRVSESTSGAQGDSGSFDPAISDNGQFVAFATDAKNLSVKLDRNHAQDVYVHNRLSGQTNRVNINNDGKQANSDSLEPDISGDGRYVAFTSTADNLSVKGDHNDAYDVFVYDRRTRKTNRISVNSKGKEGNGSSVQPSLSYDGRYVAFASNARNLDDNDRNGAADVFVYDRKTQKATRVSVASSGQQANGASYYPAISSSGRYVAFVSDATNLVPDDTNAKNDVFVHDMKTGRTTVVSVSSSGELANQGIAQDAATISISPNGRMVGFVSYSTNLVANDINNAPDAFVHDRRTQTTVRVGRQSIWVNLANTLAAFDSIAPDEAMGDTNNAYDVFVRPL